MVITIGYTGIYMDISAEEKLDMVLEKLTHIEHLLTIGEDFPEDDEIELIREFAEKKKNGEIELSSLEETLDGL